MDGGFRRLGATPGRSAATSAHLVGLWKSHSANLRPLVSTHTVNFTAVHSRLEIMATPTLQERHTKGERRGARGSKMTAIVS